jgi:hypothetical protein
MDFHSRGKIMPTSSSSRLPERQNDSGATADIFALLDESERSPAATARLHAENIDYHIKSISNSLTLIDTLPYIFQFMAFKAAVCARARNPQLRRPATLRTLDPTGEEHLETRNCEHGMGANPP